VNNAVEFRKSKKSVTLILSKSVIAEIIKGKNNNNNNNNNNLGLKEEKNT
jgi:hypothetical protein